MKQSIKTAVMVLVAMFAFSTAADAQFGKGHERFLLNKRSLHYYSSFS